MKLAVISVTRRGAGLGEVLARKLGTGVDLYVKRGRGDESIATGFDRLGELVDTIYRRYTGLVFIMAAGIVVRVIAPHVRDKRLDPAVVVMDEGGEHVVSLLSGHIGGANDLARLIGPAIGARPVITTATDVAGKPAADMLAVRLGLEIEPFERLKEINAAIVSGEQVSFLIDETLAEAGQLNDKALIDGIDLLPLGSLALSGPVDAAVVITDKELAIDKPHLYLRPRTLAIGVGCRRGAASEEILRAIAAACRSIGRSAKSIAVVGTTVAKENEAGLLEAARLLAAPLAVYDNSALQAVIDQNDLATSKFVTQQIGVGSVCEPAALLAAKADRLLLGKTVFGKVTVAIAEVKSQLSD